MMQNKYIALTLIESNGQGKKCKFRWVDLELLPPAEERVVGEGGIPKEAVSDL